MRVREESSGMEQFVLNNLHHDQGGLVYNTVFKSPMVSRRRTICYDEIHPRHPKDGGPFSLVRYANSWQLGYGEWGVEGPDRNNKTSDHMFRGGVYVYPDSSTLPPRNDAEAADLGAACYRKFSPLKPVVSGGQFLYEIRDMGPKAIMSQLKTFLKLGRNLGFNSLGRVSTHAAKNAADSYLAYQFGWKPFVKDVLDWLESVKKIDSQIARLRAENGKWLRKSGVLFKSASTSSKSSVVGVSGNPVYPYYVYGTESRKTDTEVQRKCWFKGSFRYYIPELNDPKWGKFKAARILWGVDITPQLMWQVMPWSWLINWCVDIESLIHNLTSQVSDNLVSNGAWVMLKTTTKSTASYSVSTKVINQITGQTRRTYPLSASCISIQESKARAAASPFGFGVNLPELSAWRVSILSALGLSKLRFPNLKLP